MIPSALAGDHVPGHERRKFLRWDPAIVHSFSGLEGDFRLFAHNLRPIHIEDGVRRIADLPAQQDKL